MSEQHMPYRIRIQAAGPYVVTGGAPLRELIITPDGRGYKFVEGRTFPVKERYLLCRCGRSKTPPFCDGSHAAAGFMGQEVADKAPYSQRHGVQQGPGLDLLDDGRCAYARFCHQDKGDVWQLTDLSDHPAAKTQAIRGAMTCPSGRLYAREKDGAVHMPVFEPGIYIIQDPEQHCSSGILVRGGIPIEGADGTVYEVREQVMLCRCGNSENTPFCDAGHIPAGFRDKYFQNG